MKMKVFYFLVALFAAASSQCVNRDVPPARKPLAECARGAWTNWFSLDDATNNCDSEYHADIYTRYPSQVCKNPTAVDVALVNPPPMHQYVWNILISIPEVRCCGSSHIFGNMCHICHDYKVRYCCSPVIGDCESSLFILAHWTPWYDLDDPWTNSNDDETVNAIEKKTDRPLCKWRSAIHARLTNGLPYFVGGNTFTKLNPTDGLLCESLGQKCHDYEVRFCCKTLLEVAAEESTHDQTLTVG